MPGDLTYILLVVAALGLAALLGAVCGIAIARRSRQADGSVSSGRTIVSPGSRSKTARSDGGSNHASASTARGISAGGWGAYAVPRQRKRAGFFGPRLPSTTPLPLLPAPDSQGREAADFPMTMTVSYQEAVEQHLSIAPREGTSDALAPLQLPAPGTARQEPPAITAFTPPGAAESLVGLTGCTPFSPPFLSSHKDPAKTDTEEVEWRDVDACLRIRLKARDDGIDQDFRTLQIVGIGIEDGRRVILTIDGPFCAAQAIPIDDIRDTIDADTLERIDNPWNWLKTRDWRPDATPLPPGF